MCILNAQNLFLAAGRILAGGGLKDADLDNVAIGAAVLTAAGNQRQCCDQSQQQSNKLFHLVFLHKMFAHVLQKRSLWLPVYFIRNAA